MENGNQESFTTSDDISTADLEKGFREAQEQEQGAGEQVTESPDAAAVVPEGGAQPEQTATPADWSQAPLPESHPQYGKFKTWGELNQSYEASSREAHRLAEQQKQLELRERGYQQLLERAIQARQQPARAAGFDEAQYQKLLQISPDKAMAYLVESGLKANPNALKSILQPYEQKLANIEERHADEEYRRKMDADYAQLAMRFPEAKQGTPEYSAAEKFWQENEWCGDLAKAYGQVNAQEIAFKVANFDIVAQKLRAMEAKLVDKRNKSATVKSTPARPASVTDSNPARAAAEYMAAQGKPVPDYLVNQMERAMADLS
jgi:hypothetical protein